MFAMILASSLTLSALGADPIATYDLDTRTLDIPIQYDPAQKDSIAELELFVSRDKGLTWTLHATAGTAAESFTFRAPRDGVYSFALVIVKTDGTQEPKELSKIVPAYHVRIDTAATAVNKPAQEKK